MITFDYGGSKIGQKRSLTNCTTYKCSCSKISVRFFDYTKVFLWNFGSSYYILVRLN